MPSHRFRGIPSQQRSSYYRMVERGLSLHIDSKKSQNVLLGPVCKHRRGSTLERYMFCLQFTMVYMANRSILCVIGCAVKDPVLLQTTALKSKKIEKE